MFSVDLLCLFCVLGSDGSIGAQYGTRWARCQNTNIEVLSVDYWLWGWYTSVDHISSISWMWWLIAYFVMMLNKILRKRIARWISVELIILRSINKDTTNHPLIVPYIGTHAAFFSRTPFDCWPVSIHHEQMYIGPWWVDGRITPILLQ